MRLDAVITALAADENPFLQKAGIVCYGCSPVMFEALTPIANYHYNYKLFPVPDFPYEWANDNNLEFIPMISKKDIKLPDGSYCHMDADVVAEKSRKFTHCDLDTIAGILNDVKSKVSTKYLMMFNEAYKHSDKKPWKWQEPQDVVDYWRKFFMPLAKATDLKLVSPTTGKEEDKLMWTADVLKKCYLLKDDPDYPCDVETIQAWSIHDYQCKAKRFRRHYGEKVWYEDLAELLRDDEEVGSYDWRTYVEARPIWMTETNCNWDGGQDEDPGDKAACRRITGDAYNHKFGHGSLWE